MFEVIVDNVGTVYWGEDEDQARMNFDAYKRYVDGAGRMWPSEGVVMLQDSDIVDEYRPEGRRDADA